MTRERIAEIYAYVNRVKMRARHRALLVECLDEIEACHRALNEQPGEGLVSVPKSHLPD
jgi:hypothetical protein